MKQSQAYTCTFGSAVSILPYSDFSIEWPNDTLFQVAKLLAWVRREPPQRFVSMIPRIIGTLAYELYENAS